MVPSHQDCHLSTPIDRRIHAVGVATAWVIRRHKCTPITNGGWVEGPMSAHVVGGVRSPSIFGCYLQVVKEPPMNDVPLVGHASFPLFQCESLIPRASMHRYLQGASRPCRSAYPCRRMRPLGRQRAAKNVIPVDDLHPIGRAVSIGIGGMFEDVLIQRDERPL